MKQYLLSVYQPDGDPPPPEVLGPIVRDLENRPPSGNARQCQKQGAAG
jgi:hypothetical protein